MVKWIDLVLMTPKTCDNYWQRDKQAEFINRVKIEQKSMRTKLVTSFNPIWHGGGPFQILNVKLISLKIHINANLDKFRDAIYGQKKQEFFVALYNESTNINDFNLFSDFENFPSFLSVCIWLFGVKIRDFVSHPK